MSFLDRLIPTAVQAEQPGLYMTMKSLLNLPNTQKLQCVVVVMPKI